MKESSGILLYKIIENNLWVMLVHPSGEDNINSPWSIPKGLVDLGENIEQAARRETLEETGLNIDNLIYLGWVIYSNKKKKVHCFISKAEDDCNPICASWEIDQVEFLPINKAKYLLHKDQAKFLDRLQEMLKGDI